MTLELFVLVSGPPDIISFIDFFLFRDLILEVDVLFPSSTK